jgi:hypothetical protein
MILVMTEITATFKKINGCLLWRWRWWLIKSDGRREVRPQEGPWPRWWTATKKLRSTLFCLPTQDPSSVSQQIWRKEGRHFTAPEWTVSQQQRERPIWLANYFCPSILISNFWEENLNGLTGATCQPWFECWAGGGHAHMVAVGPGFRAVLQGSVIQGIAEGVRRTRSSVTQWLKAGFMVRQLCSNPHSALTPMWLWTVILPSLS